MQKDEEEERKRKRKREEGIEKGCGGSDRDGTGQQYKETSREKKKERQGKKIEYENRSAFDLPSQGIHQHHVSK